MISKSQLIYVTLDLRRGMWVPEATGAKIVCSYKSDLLNWMREQGADIWCFEEEYPEAEIPKSSFLLLSRALTLNMLRDLKTDLQFIVFKPSNKIKRWVEEQGWELMASDVAVCRQLEDKIEFADLANRHNVVLPAHKMVLWNPDDLGQYHSQFGDSLVVQGRMGHAGSCTYLVSKESKGSELMDGTRVKISEFIDGKTYTVNAYVSPKGILAVGPIWQQIMHVAEWNTYDYGTVGVSPALKLEEADKNMLKESLLSLVPIFQEVGYVGFFGIDMIKDPSGKWYVIECNPRLTATVSLQCLDDEIHERTALLKLHAERSELKEHRFDFLGRGEEGGGESSLPLGESKREGGGQEVFSQILLRNTKKRPWTPPKTLKSGIYAQDESGIWKVKTRTYDAQALEAGECLLLLSHPAGTMIDPGSDYASIQWKGSVLDKDDQIDDRLMDFYERLVLGRYVREKDLWTDRYAKLGEKNDHPVFLQRKPVKMKKEKASSSKHVQTQLQKDEVFQLLGETDSHYLVKKTDETRGWLSKEIQLEEAEEGEFVMPGKQSLNAESFFDRWKGTPYRFGGNSEEGIDCSAFVQRYFWEVRGKMIPKYSQDQRVVTGNHIERSELQDDDLIFMHSKAKPYAHIGLYRGGKVWHSSLETGVVSQDFGELEQKYVIEEFRRFRLNEAD